MAWNPVFAIRLRFFHVGVVRQPPLQFPHVAGFDVSKLSDFDPGVTVRASQLELDEVLGQYQEQFVDRRRPSFNDPLIFQLPVPSERVMTVGKNAPSE